MSKTVSTIALVVGISVASATSGVAQVQDSSSAVSSFWKSVVEGAGSEVGGVVAGYALSALGLSGPSQEDAELEAIESLLTDIDNELEELINEIQDLECLTSQNDLTPDIQAIQGIYNTYSQWVKESPTVPCWEKSNTEGDVCYAQTNVISTWLTEVTDPENGVQARLDGIADTLLQDTTGLIPECVKDITNNFTSSSTDGPAQHVFDDYYYSLVQQLTNYYYGIQAQGAALLSEAGHLQACLSLGSSECEFPGQSSTSAASAVSSSATPSNPGAICEDAAPGSQAAADCMNAQSAVANVYEAVRAQLIEAGAPYTNLVVAKSWEGDVVVLSLEDFTNAATANDEIIQFPPCPTPLTSADPCGFTVGPYDHSMPNGNEISYGGYDFWAQQGATTLLDLLSNYNNESAGDTSGTLGQWMNSVGFENAENKIVLTPNTGNNWGLDTVCFLDTSINRSSSKQPWCDGGGGVQNTDNLAKEGDSGGCGAGCSYQDYSEADFTGSSVAPDFYTMSVSATTTNTTAYEWATKPGWTTDEQGNAKFHHFHWPAFEVSSRQLGSDWCTVRNPGILPEDNVNPGGIPTMCGSDLQTWLDAVLEDPEVSFQVVGAEEDTTLLGAHRNRNDGGGKRLRLMGPRGVGSHVIAVQFDEDRVQRFLERGPLARATLVLNIADNHGHWGVEGQQVTARELLVDFVEGNGDVVADDRGFGRGATWNCAVDAEIGDDVEDCEVDWASRWRRGAVSTLHHDGLLGPVEWDVTENVENGVRAWLIWKDSRSRGGSVDYYSREGGRELSDMGLVPTLILER